WGIGGLSSEIFSAKEDLDDSNVFDDYLTRDNQTNMAAVGLTHTLLIDEKSYLKTTLAAMGQTIDYLNDTINIRTNTPVNINEERYDQNRISLAAYYSRKLNTRLTLKAGAFASVLTYDLFQDSLSYINNARNTSLNEQGAAGLVQPWIQFRYRPTIQWTINIGAHSQYFGLGGDQPTFEPRLGIAYALNERQTLSFAYGLHSRILPVGAYFTQIERADGSFDTPNRTLDLIKAHHLVLAYDHKIGRNARFHVEAYYQRLYDVPAAADSNISYWMLNDIDGFPKQALLSDGQGRNFGVDVSLEKAFQQGTFFILSGSVFASQFRTRADENWLDTRYNSDFAFTFLGGKEWSLKKSGVFQLGLKILSNGGMRLPELTSDQLINGSSRLAPISNINSYTNSARTYFRPDLQIAYRKDRASRAWRIALDIQNVVSRINDDGLEYVFDGETQTWDFRKQSGLTPILSFQIDF
ncbi:MAG: TonB-dependent receptor, partial [Bacteroidota bacterium]